MLFPERSAGILLPVSSFPSSSGIGDLGNAARLVVEWTKACGFSYLQVLPVHPTGYGDCPYAPLSVHAGNPNFISLDNFLQNGILSESEVNSLRREHADFIDYGQIIPVKLALLRVAFARWQDQVNLVELTEFGQFCGLHQSWLKHWAVFMAQKRIEPSAWWDWSSSSLKHCEHQAIEQFITEHSDEYNFECWLQWIFFTQWDEFKSFASDHEVKLIGDVPLYVSPDSVEAWANPEVLTNEVAGVPPDRHQASTGQLWNNPVYAWETNTEVVRNWWIARLQWLAQLFDVIRIDHFRGLLTAWAVPAGSSTAVNGRWMSVPGYDLFRELQSLRGEQLPFIAEDLGEMSDQQVEELSAFRREFQIPGIALTIIYGFDGNPRNPFHPGSLDAAPHDRVAYTSTHDDNTVHGWWHDEADWSVRERIIAYHNEKFWHEFGQPAWSLCEIVAYSGAQMVILRWQDVFDLPANFRDNMPGVASGNWSVRMPAWALDECHIHRVRALLGASGRLS